ncbi:hypothetical protein ACKI2N_008915 [Cupriavidus sp. 30B13]|uniref:hypothetical protein n=1 Tax=Cupriavidus sp. 30B13 TaxID=3384241 RepID=UPI003B9099B3
MYIVAAGWLYVTLMMAITEHTVVAGVATFAFYGLGPVAILMYIMGTPGRRRRRKAEEAMAERQATDGQTPSATSATSAPSAPSAQSGTGAEPAPAPRE